MPVSDKKRAYGSKLQDFIEEYKAIFLVGVDNVGSTQMQQIRVALRDQAEVLMGKNVCTRQLSLWLHSHHWLTRALYADHHPQGREGFPEEE
jgi:hypothetical protein